MTVLRDIVADDGAPTNETSDSGAAFISARTAGRAAASQFILTLPPHKYELLTTSGPDQYITDGVADMIIQGYGATLDDNAGAGSGFNLGTDSGIASDDAHSARIATILAGATSFTCLDPTKAALFKVGGPALLAGYPLQSDWQSPGGYPPNPHFFKYVTVTGKSGAAVSFAPPIDFDLKSTWPLYNSGAAGQADPGGPATAYAISSSFNASLVVRGPRLNRANASSCAGLVFEFRDVSSDSDIFPTQCGEWRGINSSLLGTMEVDKIIGKMVIDNTGTGAINIQSSAPDVLIVRNGSRIANLAGTPKRLIAKDSTISVLRVGATSFGRTDAIFLENCNLPSIGAPSALLVKGPGDAGVNNCFQMSGGIITIPNGAVISGAANNGSGAIRLTVDSSAGFVTGKTYLVQSVGDPQAGTGTLEANGAWPFTVVDGTHVDLQGSTFTHAYTSGGTVQGGAQAWAVPGTWLGWSGALETLGPFFQVLDVTQDAVSTYVHTTESGGFPTVGLTAGKLFIQVHPAPSAAFPNCFGSADALDLAQMPAGQPLYSYSRRSHTKSSGTVNRRVWGNVVSIEIDVQTPYTGAQGTLTLNSVEGVIAGGAQSNYQPVVNVRAPGKRTITAAGVTGTQGGDSGLALPNAVTWLGGIFQASPSADVSGENAGPVVVITISADQGISTQAVAFCDFN